jgi:hypothetical protein
MLEVGINSFSTHLYLIFFFCSGSAISPSRAILFYDTEPDKTNKKKNKSIRRAKKGERGIRTLDSSLF